MPPESQGPRTEAPMLKAPAYISQFIASRWAAARFMLERALLRPLDVPKQRLIDPEVSVFATTSCAQHVIFVSQRLNERTA